jgi:hypothetical protein
MRWLFSRCLRASRAGCIRPTSLSGAKVPRTHYGDHDRLIALQAGAGGHVAAVRPGRGVCCRDVLQSRWGQQGDSRVIGHRSVVLVAYR